MAAAMATQAMTTFRWDQISAVALFLFTWWGMTFF
tara:strand:- start:4959 stop:5063 length:105 start_codon:yes stop_codon:yes gene_type:complete